MSSTRALIEAYKLENERLNERLDEVQGRIRVANASVRQRCRKEMAKLDAQIAIAKVFE